MGSRVPSVTVRLVGQANNSYKFLIQNGNAHSITAFEVLLVPRGVAKKGGRFRCQGRCSPSSEVDSAETAAIKAGGTTLLEYDSATVAGGAVVVEAAVFDDGSYAGSERAAAFLIANQIADQAEFDRIVPAVENIMASKIPPSVGKAARIESQLVDLPVDVDSTMLATFYRWFPNLRDCNSHFPHVMQEVAVQEKAEVQGKLQRLLSRGDPSEVALRQWWSATERYLSGFGCRECSARMASPSPPVRQRTISVGCKDGTNGGMQEGSAGVALSVEMTDDSDADNDSADEGTDQTAVNEADPGDTTQDSDEDKLSMTDEPAEPTAALAAPETGTLPAPPLVHPVPPVQPAPLRSPQVAANHSPREVPTFATTRPVPIPPQLSAFGFGGSIPGGATLQGVRGAGQETPRPVTDDQLYPEYFRYLIAWDKYLSAGGTPVAAAKRGMSPDPFPVETNERTRKIVTLAAYDCGRALQRSMMELQPELTTRVQAPAAAAVAPRFLPYLVLGPPSPQALRIERSEDARAKIVTSRLEDLRLQLGTTSFLELDSYVHGLYHVGPGRREPVPESARFERYLRYIASLDEFSSNDGKEGKAAARLRSDEQQACQMSDKDESVLEQVADDYQQELAAQRLINLTVLGELGTNYSVPSGWPLESGTRAEERKGIADSHIEQLRSRLAEASFHKVEERAHLVYEFAVPRRVVPLDARKTQAIADEHPRAAP